MPEGAQPKRISATQAFYTFFLSGAAFSCALALVIVWHYSNAAMSEFQIKSATTEAEASLKNLRLYIDDRRSAFEQLAEDQFIIGATFGNSNALRRAEQLIGSFDLFSDQRRVALLSLTLEPIVDRRAANFGQLEYSDSVMLPQAATLTELGVTAPQISHYEANGAFYIAMSVPVLQGDIVEGVLYSEFEFGASLSDPAATSFLMLGSSVSATSQYKIQQKQPDHFMVISSDVPGTSITHHYLRNVAKLEQTRDLALAKTGGALVLGLGLAFAAICAIGRALMLNPYKALEASRASLSRSNQTLEHSALHDALTGLPNRRFLDQHLTALSEGAEPGHDRRYAILHIDLDRFKQINDTLGHAAGDYVLTQVGGLLSARQGAAEFVARIGGDEFVMVISDISGAADIEARARFLVNALRQPLQFDGNECRFGASIGIATGVRGQDDAARVLVDADIALYRAKEAGRNGFMFFTEADAINIRQKKTLADEIHRALENDEFFPVYQPQVDAISLELAGVEALARWRHPTRGVLAPIEFIEVANDLGVLQEIDARILEKALIERKLCLPHGFAPPRVSVNVSSRRLSDPTLVENVRKLDFRPGDLSFELLESSFFDEIGGAVSQNLTELRSLGVSIELDDFGTGHSSIISLVRLAPRSLKIDRQFVLPAVESATSRRLISAMIDIGLVLDVDVVAEGVETEEHITVLRELGCQYFQGYAIAHPLPIDELINWMRRRTDLKTAV